MRTKSHRLALCGGAAMGMGGAAFMSEFDILALILLVVSVALFECAVWSAREDAVPEGEMAIEREGDDIFVGVSFFSPSSLAKKRPGDAVTLRVVERDISKAKEFLEEMEAPDED